METSTIKPVKQIYAVDLFCGAGGLTRGLLDAGIKVRAGIDIDPFCVVMSSRTPRPRSCRLPKSL